MASRVAAVSVILNVSLFSTAFPTPVLLAHEGQGHQGIAMDAM